VQIVDEKNVEDNEGTIGHVAEDFGNLRVVKARVYCYRRCFDRRGFDHQRGLGYLQLSEQIVLPELCRPL
jgi:hypothetical protein